MQRCVAPLVPVILLFLMPSPAVAQEKGKAGVTMGFPGSVGLLWHVTEDIAVRPEFSFAWSSSEAGTGASDGSTVSTGASVLFYLRKWDDLATYVSPRYAFGRTTSTSDSDFAGESERTSRSHLISGSFGAQYWLGQRFSAFGEVGLAYTRGTSETDIDLPPGLPPSLLTDVTSSSFATRSAVGVVFYF